MKLLRVLVGIKPARGIVARIRWPGEVGDRAPPLAVSMQIVESALARDFEETIGRQRASYTVT